MVKLHEVDPREQDGRDTLSRYKAQTRAASLASLEILENNTVDRVFCDWHDDFVVRKIIDGKTYYHFFQVKTKKKRNAQWSLIDIFGINNKKKPEDIVDRITDSFAGKLLIHTVNFSASCEKVIFLTNIHVKDEVEDLLEALDEEDFTNKTLAALVEHFNNCFSDGTQLYKEHEVKSLISKFGIDPGVEYLKVEGAIFESIAREKIFQYSEIDLQYMEAREIIDNLMALVESKSVGVLPKSLDEKTLDELAGVGIDELLEVLSLSKIGYDMLTSGGDTKALKSLSILQRILKKTDTPKQLIDYAAKCKTEWDIWYRKYRHDVPDFNLMMLESKLSDAVKQRIVTGFGFTELKEDVERIFSDLKKEKCFTALSEEIVLGGLFSVMVRSQ